MCASLVGSIFTFNSTAEGNEQLGSIVIQPIQRALPLSHLQVKFRSKQLPLVANFYFKLNYFLILFEFKMATREVV